MNRIWPVLFKVVSLCFIGSLVCQFTLGLSPAGVTGITLAKAEAAPPPTVAAVTPDQAANDLDLPVTITGTGFVEGLSVALSIQPLSGPPQTFSLVDLDLKNSTSLNAAVPWGLDPGVYTLTVTNLDGQSGALPDAFTITTGFGVWASDGPYGGAVTTLLADPANTSTLYAALQSPTSPIGIGLFRSTDGGTSWEMVLADIANQAHAADLSVSSPASIYAFRWSQGLARSDDGGDNWTTLAVPNASCADTRVFASPVEAETVYLTMNCPQGGDIYKSADRGASWDSVKGNLAGDLHMTALAINPEDPEILVAGDTSGNVFRSMNSGLDWAPLGKPDNFISDLAISPYGDHELWAAGADNMGHWGNLWKYVGTGWVQVLIGTDAQNQATSILFSPATAGTLWAGTMQGAFQSTNSGDTWTPLSAVAWGVSTLALDPTGQQARLVGYNGQGVYRTTDGGANWEPANQGLAGVFPNGLAIDPTDPAVVYTTAHGVGIFNSTNGGSSWSKLDSNNGIPSAPLVDPFDPQRVYVAAGGDVEISSDGGTTWHKVTLPLPPDSPSTWGVRVISLLALDQPGRLLIGAGFADSAAPSWSFAGGGIYTSLDYGESWSYVEMEQGQDSMPVAVLTADPSHPATIYAGTGYCCPGQGNGVWKSEDRGATWSPSGMAGLQVTGIAVNPARSRHVYAVNINQFYFSDDGGDTWTLRATQASGIDKLLVVPTTVPTLYQYGWGGIVRSTDGGLHWARAAGSLGYTETNTIATAMVGDRLILYVGSAGGPILQGLQGITGMPLGNPAFLNAGVYRNTILDISSNVFVPLVLR